MIDNPLPTHGRREGYVLTPRQMRLILTMPKAENHIHIEGSILPRTLLRLAERNKISIPIEKEDDLQKYILEHVHSLNTFMMCDRLFNSVCITEQDYEEVIYDLAVDAKEQNIIYQEYFLDYPLNEERGIPLEVVMEGYRRGQKRALEELGVDIVYLAGIDRTLPREQCTAFIRNMKGYLDMVEGIGMDCEEIGNPCRDFVEAYKVAKDMGLFLTAHAGEDKDVANGDKEVWDALNLLHCQRIDHGCQAIKDPALMDYLAENKILLTVCPSANVGSHNVPGYLEHPVREFFKRGIPCSINSDDPPYSGDLIQQYARTLSLIGMEEDELIEMGRNAFVYSIRAQKYLPIFDEWLERWKKE